VKVIIPFIKVPGGDSVGRDMLSPVSGEAFWRTLCDLDYEATSMSVELDGQ